MCKARIFTSVLVTVALALFVAGCGESSSSKDSASSKAKSSSKPEEGRGDIIDNQPAGGPTDQWIELRDPVKNAFTVEGPEGWENVAYSVGDFTDNRNVVTAQSADKSAVIFLGDPKIPTYWDPAQANDVTRFVAERDELTKIEGYEPATTYGPAYVSRKFGELDRFEIVETNENPEFVARAEAKLAKHGFTPQQAHSVDVHFTYGSGKEKRSGVVNVSTLDQGFAWHVSVGGLSTTGDPRDYLEMLFHMGDSLESTDEYLAASKANHEQTMARLQADHRSRMQQIQDSSAAHQQRMQSIWKANDASMESWNSRMESMDNNQRGFLNYIREENTVSAGGSGSTFQVESGHDRYWVDPSNGKYVAGDANFGESQLRELGLDPGRYSEMQVVR